MVHRRAGRWFVVAGLMVLIVFSLALTWIPVEAQILGTNWTGTFYNNVTLSGSPVATDVQYPTGLCFVWGEFKPTAGSDQQCIQGNVLSSVNPNEFSAVFTSTQTYPQTGTYVFTLRFNDGLRLYVDNVLVYDRFDNDTAEDTYIDEYINLNLSAGSHQLRAEYVERTGTAILQVQWGLTNPAGSTPTPQPTNELLQNGGFEGKLVGDLEGKVKPWKIVNKRGDKAICTPSSFAYTGACAFRFYGDAAENSKLQQVANLDGQTFAAGDELRFSAWILADEPAAATADLTLVLLVKFSDGSAPLKVEVPVEVTTTYSLLETVLPLTGQPVSKVRVRFNNHTEIGSVYIDQVSLLLETVGGAIIPLPLNNANDDSAIRARDMP